jgi:hypothetical protein
MEFDSFISFVKKIKEAGWNYFGAEQMLCKCGKRIIFFLPSDLEKIKSL